LHDKTYNDTDYKSKPVSKKGASKKELNVKTMLEMDNIAEELSDSRLIELAQDIVDGYKADKESRSMREVRMEAAMKLAMQETDEKTSPWEGCANVIIPMITTASMHFAARAYDGLIDDGVVAKTKVIGNDEGIPEPVIDPMTGMPPMDEQGQPVLDPDTGEPPVNMIGAGAKKAKGDKRADFLNWQLMEQVENWETDTDRLLHILPVTGNVYRKWHWSDDKPVSGLIFPKNFVVDYFTTDLNKARKTQEFVLYPWEITERIRSGQYIKFEIGETDDQADEIVVDTRREGNESSDEGEAPHAMIEQHVRLDLDDDGYEEPYIATLHLPTEKLVRLRANYEEDGVTYKDESESEIVKIKEEVYFVKYGFIPSPDGSFYDLGFGDILYNLNESANSIINRLLDAGTLASSSSGFIGRGMKLKGGKVKVGIGEFPVIDTKGGSIRDNFVQLQHPEPSRVLFDLLGTLIDMAKEITFTNQVMEGEGSANMPVGTVLQLVEQGLTGYKAVHKRIRRAMKQELMVLSRINEIYMDERMYAEILDEPIEGNFMGVDYDIVPVADASMLTNQQKIARSQVLAQYLDDPRADGVKILEEIFEAIGADKKMVKGEPPQQEDPMIELQKMMTQVEQYKAQIKEQEAQAKTQRDAQALQLETEKAAHQAQLNEVAAQSKAHQDQMQLAIKSQEAQMKMNTQVHELELKRAEMGGKDAKTAAEIKKIDAQITEIYAKIELERHKAITAASEKEQSESKETSEKAEKQEGTKALADAVKSLKGDKKSIKLERKTDGSIVGEIS
jgi:chaperonin GroES